MSRMPILRLAALAVASTFVIACSSDKGATGEAPTAGTAPAASTAGGEQVPDAGGQVITVKMLTDGTGNRFEPATVEAKKGDVVRYVLESGVHNVHFLADSNPGRQGLPTTPGDYLQLPGQTYDVKVTWAPGSYFYQCDPHAALGMVGHVNVK